MKIKGHIDLQLMDMEGNIEYEYSQDNTIGFIPYWWLATNQPNALAGGAYSNPNATIQISDTKAEVNKFTNNIAGTMTDATFNIAGAAVPNEFWPQLTNDTANNRWIIQYKYRFQPGASTRTINTISLNNSVAALLLTTPCTQTTTQILDIFYSIYVPYDTTKYSDTQFNQQYLNSNALLGSLFSYYNYTPVYSPGTSTILNNVGISYSNNFNNRIVSTWQNGLTINSKPVSSGQALYDLQLTTTATRNFVQGTTTYTVSWQNSDNVGAIVKNIGWLPCNNVFDATSVTNSNGTCMLAINPIVPTSVSPIQSIYLKNPSYPTISPYLDPSAIGSSTGTISMDGSGLVDDDIPLMFKINIVNSGTGALATTSYNFQVRPTFGFANNVITQENTRWLYHGVGAVNPTNQISQNACHWALPNLPNSGTYSHTIPLRDNKSFVVGDATGISIVNAYTSNFVNFDSTTTPAMPTTAVVDYAVGSDGTIAVATTDQGLYIINPARTTITQYTGSSIGTGVTGSTCYSVAIKDNGDIWAAFNGALAKLPSGSSTWTIYNSTTTPSFTYVGISDNNWAHINKLFVNRTNATDQLLIVRKDVNTCVWWGPTTPTPVALSNMMAGFSYPAPTLERAIKHMPNTNSWFFNTNYTYNLQTYGNINICSFGNTGADKTFNPGNASLAVNNSQTYPFHYMTMTPMLYNGSYVMHMLMDNYFQGTNGRYNHLYVDVTGTLQRDPFSGSYGTSFVSASQANCSVMWISNKVAIYQSAANYLRIANIYEVIGASNNEAWDTYGWNSGAGQWQLNYVGNKPMHTTSQALYNGINVSFADAPTSSNFNNGEYWFAYVNRGLHKDNSTAATFGMSMNVRDSYFNSELSSYTVPSTGFGSLTNQTLNFYTMNPNLAQVYTYKGNAGVGNSGTTYSTLSVAPYSEQIFPGDFQINFSATSKALQPSTTYWCLLGFFDTTLVNPTFTTSGVGYFQFDSTGFYVRENNANKTTPTQFLASDVFSIKRTGSTISYLYNGSTIYTSTNTNSNPIRAWTLFYGEYSRTFTNINCTYNETRPIVTIGSQANSTGIFDQNYAMVEAWTTSPPSYQININGTPANVWTDPVKIPAAGEVTLLQKNGWIIFNPSDAGKAITSSVMVLKEM